MPQPIGELPRSLRSSARWERLGDAEIPAMLVHPDWASGQAVPAVIWLHGRTAHKEIDPGRPLRLVRAGIGVCAVDLPGHGERYADDLQGSRRSLDVVLQMVDELDIIVAALAQRKEFDGAALGIGGMSAGGMAALARLCRPHSFRCVSVEATSGSWLQQGHRSLFADEVAERAARHDPIRHLERWREIPVQAFHSARDRWISHEGQRSFIEGLRARYFDPRLIEFVVFEETGAPHEHLGFGRMSAEVKTRQAEFFRRWLT